MKAMILAAGRGERMRPLTEHTPKPLLRVAGKALIEYHIERLYAAGYRDIVINLHHLGVQIRDHLGDGRSFGVTIEYSEERPELLETGGGILQALPLLGNGPFLVINGDVWTECSLAPPAFEHRQLAHLVLVINPAHNRGGDFALDGNKLRSSGEEMLTFSGIGWYRAELFAGRKSGQFPLAPLLRDAIEDDRIRGHLCDARWMDVGTPQRLAQLEELLLG